MSAFLTSTIMRSSFQVVSLSLSKTFTSLFHGTSANSLIHFQVVHLPRGKSTHEIVCNCFTIQRDLLAC